MLLDRVPAAFLHFFDQRFHFLKIPTKHLHAPTALTKKQVLVSTEGCDESLATRWLVNALKQANFL